MKREEFNEIVKAETMAAFADTTEYIDSSDTVQLVASVTTVMSRAVGIAVTNALEKAGLIKFDE